MKKLQGKDIKCCNIQFFFSELRQGNGASNVCGYNDLLWKMTHKLMKKRLKLNA